LAATKIQTAIRSFLFRRNMKAIKKAKLNGQTPPYHLLLLSVKEPRKGPVKLIYGNDGLNTTPKNLSAA